MIWYNLKRFLLLFIGVYFVVLLARPGSLRGIPDTLTADLGWTLAIMLNPISLMFMIFKMKVTNESA